MRELTTTMSGVTTQVPFEQMGLAAEHTSPQSPPVAGGAELGGAAVTGVAARLPARAAGGHAGAGGAGDGARVGVLADVAAVGAVAGGAELGGAAGLRVPARSSPRCTWARRCRPCRWWRSRALGGTGCRNRRRPRCRWRRPSRSRSCRCRRSRATRRCTSAGIRRRCNRCLSRARRRRCCTHLVAVAAVVRVRGGVRLAPVVRVAVAALVGSGAQGLQPDEAAGVAGDVGAGPALAREVAAEAVVLVAPQVDVAAVLRYPAVVVLRGRAPGCSCRRGTGCWWCGGCCTGCLQVPQCPSSVSRLASQPSVSELLQSA